MASDSPLSRMIRRLLRREPRRRSAATPGARTVGDPVDPRVQEEVVEFLREWLPSDAVRRYRRMIEADPDGWSRDPHFAGGIIPEHALRGNGITEEALGVEDLEAVWPELLRRAVQAQEGDAASG